MTLEEAFSNWWESEGFNMVPIVIKEDYDRIRSMCSIAWSNGAYTMGREIQKLIQEP